MTGRVLAVAALLAMTATTLGCAQATGEVSGGESLYDGSFPVLDTGTPPMVDSAPPPTDATDASGPATWTELYTNYFGNVGVASCAGNGTCHGAMTQLGYMTSNYLCPENDQQGCYESFTSPGTAGGPNLLAAYPPFEKTYLYEVLRKSSGANIGTPMPKAPYTYTFNTTDLARIESWVAAGAKND
jgi:hypothetical protein